MNPPDGIFELPLFHKYYAFLRLLSDVLGHCPKKDRYTLGTKIYSLSLELFILLMRVNAENNYKRFGILREASLSLDFLKILLRLAKDTNAISEKTNILLQGHLQECGRMLGGWIKHQTETKKSA